MRRRLIDAYIEGELQGKKRERFEEELKRNPVLREKVEREKKVVELMRSLAREPVSAPPPLPEWVEERPDYLKWAVAVVPALAVLLFLLLPKGAEFHLIYPGDGDVISGEVVLRVEKGGRVEFTIDGISRTLKVERGIATIPLPELDVTGPVNLSLRGRKRIERVVYVEGGVLW